MVEAKKRQQEDKANENGGPTFLDVYREHNETCGAHKWCEAESAIFFSDLTDEFEAGTLLHGVSCALRMARYGLETLWRNVSADEKSELMRLDWDAIHRLLSICERTTYDLSAYLTDCRRKENQVSESAEA